MTSNSVHFASPSGVAIALSLGEKKAKLPSHGMYRAEIDVKDLAAKRELSGLLLECLEGIRDGERILAAIPASLVIELDECFAPLGQSKGSAIYLVSDEIPDDVLDALTNLPYGNIALVGITQAVDASANLPMFGDLDDALTSLGEKASWGIGYDESAVLTLLARDKEVVKKRVLAFVEKSLNSLP